MTILIAEDDPLTREALAACIASEGFTVLEAPDGRVAIDIWRTEKPDLICLDIMMPEFSGYDVCRRIRKSDPSLPILFLSAKNEERDVVAGLDLGGDDFVRKPFTRREVMARINAVLRRSHPGKTEEIFLIGELKIYPQKLQARRGETSFDLTLREMAILQLLHKHPGQPVSRDALLDHCWGQDYFPDSRTLDQHIHQLRKKIELDSASPTIIETVRSIGYRVPK